LSEVGEADLVGSRGVNLERIGWRRVHCRKGAAGSGAGGGTAGDAACEEALSTMPVKTNRKDARGIAQLMRLGWFRPGALQVDGFDGNVVHSIDFFKNSKNCTFQHDHLWNEYGNERVAELSCRTKISIPQVGLVPRQSTTGGRPHRRASPGGDPTGRLSR
jgi:hypothetical protein